MKKRFTGILPLLILCLIACVIVIIFLLIKRSAREERVVTIVNTSLKNIAHLNRLESAVHFQDDVVKSYLFQDNGVTNHLLDSSITATKLSLDSVVLFYRTDTSLAAELDSLVINVNRIIDRSSRVNSLGKEKGIEVATLFYQQNSGVGFFNQVFSNSLKVRLKTMQQLQKDEESNISAMRQVKNFIALFSFLAIALALWIARNFLLEFSVGKRVENQLKLYSEDLENKVEAKTTEIKKSEERYRTIIEQASEAIIISDQNSKILEVNDNACKMLGYSKEELCKMKVFDFIVYDSVAEVRNVNVFLEEGESVFYVRKLKRSDGTVISTESSSRRLSDDRIMSIVRDVTEKNRMEEALRTSEFNNRMVVENRILGIKWASPDGTLINANQTYCDMIGYSLDEIIGKKFSEYVHPDDIGRELTLLEKMNKGDIDNYVLEKRYRKKSGEYFWADLNLTCYRNSQTGAIEFYIALLHNIQEKKQVEEALKDSERKLRQVLSSYGDIFYVVDKDYTITLINKIAEEELSYVWKKPVKAGANLLDLIPAGSKEPVKKSLESVFRAVPVEYELNVVTDGISQWHLVNYFPVKADSGNIIGAYIISKNITEQKEVEEKLRQSVTRFELIGKTTNDAVWEWDLVTGKLWANETHQQLYGLTLEDPVPNQEMWLARIHPDDRHKILKIQDQALVSPTNIYTSEYRFNVAGVGYRNIFDRGYILRDEKGKAIRTMGSMMDITELKQAEAALISSEAKYRAFFENSMDGILFTAPDGRILAANAAACEIFQMTEAEICAAGRRGVTDAEDPNLQLFLDERKRTGKAKVELTMIRKDGSRFIAENSSSVFKDASGENRTCVIIRDVSDRKKMDRELRESELKFRKLVEQSLTGVYIIQDGKFAYVNPKLAEILGYRSEELINTIPVLDVIRPEDRALVAENLRIRLEGIKESIHYEVEALRKNGEILQVELFGNRTEYMGRPTVIGTTIDISDRKRAEKELKESEERYRSLIEQASDFIMITDIGGKIIDSNSSMCNAFGYSKEELLTMNIVELIDPVQLKTIPMRSDKLVPGEMRVWERRMICKDGSIIDVEANLKLLPDGRIMGIVRDIRERKKAEAEIRKAKELSDQVLDSSPGIFYLFNEAGKYLRWNKNLEIVTGYRKDEIAKMKPQDFFSGDEIEYIKGRIKDAFILGVNDAEAHIVTKNKKKFFYYLNAVRIEYENQVCLLGHGIDITEIKKARKELEDSYIAIRQLSEHLQNIREEERAHIARDIHDELGQQLTVLKMDASWLYKKLNAAEPDVKQKLKDLLDLMDTTVKTVRKISSELRPSLLDDMGLLPAIEWYLKEFEKRTSVKTYLKIPSKELSLTNAAKTGLFRIFQESLTNVARHANAGNVDISIQLKKGKIVMSIKDDGAGFEMEDARTKKTLGILGMQERSYMLGGDYLVKSQPGKGTNVIVSVPYPEKK